MKGLNATTTYQYVNAGAEQVLVERDMASSTLSTYFVYGTDLVSQGPAATTSRQYFVTDGLGNVKYITNSSGNQIAGYTYQPFGTITTGSATTTNHAFQTEHKDPETGLTYLRARYYDPTTGRFTARDPISGFRDDPTTQNGYNYTNNNPVNYSDPSGMIVETLWDVANVAYDIKTCDWGSLAFDTAAVLIPGVPAGLTKVAKAEKIAEEAKRVSDLATQAASNLSEKLAIEEALGKVGKVIMEKLDDPRYAVGWVKVQADHISLDGVQTVVHYMKNAATGVIEQIKIK